MNLDRKLAGWVEAGVIDAATRDRIAAFEQAQRRPYALYALIVLGGGTVALGLVSVIASNWDAISSGTKLAGDLVLGVALALATGWAVMQRRALATEVLVSIFYGFTLASLALVGQIYQLGTPTYQGLLLWSASTLPLLLLGRSRYLATLGVVGSWTTHGYTLEAVFDALDRSVAYGEEVIVALLFASPLLYLALARGGWLRRERPEYAATLEAMAWAATFAGGFTLQFCWYDDLSENDALRGGLLVCAVIVSAFAAGLPRLYPGLPRERLATLWFIFGFAWLSLAVGVGFERDEHPFIGALLQLVWLAAFARVSIQAGLIQVFNALTALIALRVLIIYFEVFGSLLDTGLGLITGGALTLLLAWIWRRKTRALTLRSTPPPGASHVA